MRTVDQRGRCERLADSPIHDLPVPELETVRVAEERARELGVDLRRIRSPGSPRTVAA
ncbi:hypothetical protein [Actinosynnema sp. NPDC020468]|uniref:hypothetical protein n=1 Tax=Actinosynnema sp. NPDC020468 TaxID=3154488 RepID=UPI0033CF0EB1